MEKSCQHVNMSSSVLATLAKTINQPKIDEHYPPKHSSTKDCKRGSALFVVEHNLPFAVTYIWESTNQSYTTSCLDFDATHCAGNKCRIINHLYGPAPFFVACNNSVDDGGWIVIQRRVNGSVDFYRNWTEYKAGFGDLDSELFIGLDKLHALTSTLKPVELLIQLQDFDDILKYARYDDFHIGNESEKYKLIKLGSYIGDTGDSLSQHVGYNFSTKDRDNDIGNENYAEIKNGAWWYEDCGWRPAD